MPPHEPLWELIRARTTLIELANVRGRAARPAKVVRGLSRVEV